MAKAPEGWTWQPFEIEWTDEDEAAADAAWAEVAAEKEAERAAARQAKDTENKGDKNEDKEGDTKDEEEEFLIDDRSLMWPPPPAHTGTSQMTDNKDAPRPPSLAEIQALRRDWAPMLIDDSELFNLVPPPPDDGEELAEDEDWDALFADEDDENE